MDTDFHSELSVSLWYDILCVLCFLLCMFLLYITVLLPVGVIKDYDNSTPSTLNGLPGLTPRTPWTVTDTSEHIWFQFLVFLSSSF